MGSARPFPLKRPCQSCDAEDLHPLPVPLSRDHQRCPVCQAVLEGSLADGYALAWSPYREGDLLSGDTALCYWNVTTGVGGRHGSLLSFFTPGY